jgi:hypothetical protein
MYNTNHIIDSILENDQLMEQWFEYALMLEEAGEIAGAELALLEAIEHESWKLLWQERLSDEELSGSQEQSYASVQREHQYPTDADVDRWYEQHCNRVLSGCYSHA